MTDPARCPACGHLVRVDTGAASSTTTTSPRRVGAGTSDEVRYGLQRVGQRKAGPGRDEKRR
jgi:hypothetical protein